MFEILLNTAKLAISKDARESASAIIDLFHNSPEWEKDICTIDAKIGKDEKEKSLLINDLVKNKLKNLKYEESIVNNFSYIYAELSDNLFEHGCTDKEQVRILLDITESYTAASFFNSKSIKFNFKEELDTKNFDPTSTRGRGIAISKIKADEITSIGTKGIKFIVYNKPIKTSVKLISDKEIAIIIESGHDNPSLSKKIIAELNNFLTEKYYPYHEKEAEYEDIIIFLDSDIYDSAYKRRSKAHAIKKTELIGSLLHYIRENELNNIRVIHSDHELQRLLPDNIFSTEYIKS